MDEILIKIGRRWAVVVDYGQAGGIGRKGCWCEDRDGGWGVGPTPEKAMAGCRPVTFPTKRAALEAAEVM